MRTTGLALLLAASPVAVEAPGLENVYRLTDQLYSGSTPESDAGFESLRKLGVKTIISVDGAAPDVARAKRFGLRYVHLPVGYYGLPADKVLALAKAVMEMPGPFYVHCHHGKHRGPAAASVALRCLEDKCTVADSLRVMTMAGTDPRYAGLFAAVRGFKPPTAAELATVPRVLPESAAVPPLVRAMVEVDERWDRLKAAKAAGWKDPAASAREALLLAEAYRELARTAVKDRPVEFRRLLEEAAANAFALEKAIPDGGDRREAAFRRASADCAGCHGKYRDR